MKWALLIASSRSFKSNFIPFLDFFNHGADGGEMKYDSTARLYTVVVKRSYRIGEQVLLKYGDLRNEELLARYHFCQG